METSKRNILVAPLNWGLGHATRCIPIIHKLQKNGFNPIIASDGNALALLKKEFPDLLHLELPSYHIEYAKNTQNLKWKLLKNSPKTLFAIFSEKQMVKKWIAEFSLQGIISDNRLGVHSKKIPSVIITHQLTVLSGNTTWISSKLHQFFIKKFAECWIPDFSKWPNLSGDLGHFKRKDFPLKYIGPISRFEKKELPLEYDLMILISGPEPQREILERKLKIEAESFKGKVIFIKGIIEQEQKSEIINNITYYNFMTTAELEKAFNQSELVLCRSGYTTIMDLAMLGKKAYFIPTPGQFEQEYLARKLKREGLFTYAKQEFFTIDRLMEAQFYRGFNAMQCETEWEPLFALFEQAECFSI